MEEKPKEIEISKEEFKRLLARARSIRRLKNFIIFTLGFALASVIYLLVRFI